MERGKGAGGAGWSGCIDASGEVERWMGDGGCLWEQGGRGVVVDFSYLVLLPLIKEKHLKEKHLKKNDERSSAAEEEKG